MRHFVSIPVLVILVACSPVGADGDEAEPQLPGGDLGKADDLSELPDWRLVGAWAYPFHSSGGDPWNRMVLNDDRSLAIELACAEGDSCEPLTGTWTYGEPEIVGTTADGHYHALEWPLTLHFDDGQVTELVFENPPEGWHISVPGQTRTDARHEAVLHFEDGARLPMKRPECEAASQCTGAGLFGVCAATSGDAPVCDSRADACVCTTQAPAPDTVVDPLPAYWGRDGFENGGYCDYYVGEGYPARAQARGQCSGGRLRYCVITAADGDTNRAAFAEKWCEHGCGTDSFGYAVCREESGHPMDLYDLCGTSSPLASIGRCGPGAGGESAFHRAWCDGGTPAHETCTTELSFGCETHRNHQAFCPGGAE